MGSRRDCIVSYSDLIGIKKLMWKRDPNASKLMREMYDLVRNEAGTILKQHEHIYAWNDSVLLFAYLDESSDGAKPILDEVNKLKQKIDKLPSFEGNANRSFVIVVQGRPFEDSIANATNMVDEEGPDENGVRVTIVRASSYALANIFAIEKEVHGKPNKNQWVWYLDQRIVDRGQPSIKELTSEPIQLLRRGDRPTKVYIYDGFPWESA